MRVYPDVFTRTAYDNGSNVVDTYVGWNSTTVAMKAGVRFTASSITKLAGVDVIYRTEAVTSGTIFVQVRAAGATTGAPGAVLYTKSFNTVDYLPSGDLGAYITFPFGDDAPVIAAGSDYWITVKTPVGILYPGGCQSTGTLELGRSFYEGSVDTTAWSPLIITTEYVWIMRTVEVVPCLAPSGLIASNIMSNAALLGWTENGGASAWDIEWGPAGFTQGLGTLVSGVSNPYMLGSLSDNTPYDFYVRSSCGGSSYGPWAGPLSFTTICNSAVTPFTEGFEAVTFAPDCWTNTSVSGPYLWARSDAASGYGVGTASAFADFYTHEAGSTYDLRTKPFDISGLTMPTLKFDFAYAAASTFATSEGLEIYTSTNFGATWTLLITMTGGEFGTLNTGGVVGDVFVPLPTEWGTQNLALPSGTNMIKFRAISDYGNNLYLDNVTVTGAPVITTFAATDITATGATLNGTVDANYLSTAVSFEYGLDNTYGSSAAATPATVTGHAGTPVSAAIGSLAFSTTYHYRAVGVNGAGTFYGDDMTFTTLSGVPVTNIVQNTIVTGSACFDATSTIYVAGGGTYFTVSPTGNATFIAGVNIIYYPGTTVQAGGYMHGYIAAGGPWCGAKSSTIPDAITQPEVTTPVTVEQAFFSLYPNPTNGNFTLVQKGEKQYGTVKVEVYTMNGEKVMTEQMIGEKKHEFSFSEVPAGLYFVRIIADGYVETIKLIKTR